MLQLPLLQLLLVLLVINMDLCSIYYIASTRL